MKRLSATVCLTIAVLLGSAGMSLSVDPYSFDKMSGSYVCNKIETILEHGQVSTDTEHIFVEINVLPQNEIQRKTIRQRRFELGCKEEGTDLLLSGMHLV